MAAQLESLRYVSDTESPGDSEVWVTFYINGISVEAGWRVIAEHEKDLDAIVVGKVVAHGPLTLAWITTHAVSAINHQWEPDWKWLGSEVQRLSIKPERLIERIHDIFTMAQSEQTVAGVLTLIRDTLKLVPAQYNMMRALANVEESLRLHGY